MKRREFLGMLAAVLAAKTVRAADRAPRILLRSSWQVVNIGDIAHTPGVLALIEKHLPDAEVRLWASADLSDEVAAMEHRRFQNLKIVKGTIGADGRASDPDLQESVEWCDFLLHGSGPSFVAARDVGAFVKHVGKPFGIYGITYGGADETVRTLMSRAEFLYFRDSVSLERARADGIASARMEFGPDGAFACDLANEEAAQALLAAHGLEERKFLCCIPRLRYTPYWLIRKNRPLDPDKDRRNREMAEHDHAPLREAIAAVVRETDHRVLLCPEDMTQMAVGKEHVFDKLPNDVKDRVVWRKKYWLTDEALSTYRLSSGLFGLEMHSPIMCIGNGIPALVGRFEEQTSKGYMWRDIGLGDWLFNWDVPSEVEKLSETVLSLIREPDKARDKAAAASQRVADLHAASMAVVGKAALRQ
jgi:polysaccharide pyruvyl transferase WcaK-like protein